MYEKSEPLLVESLPVTNEESSSSSVASPNAQVSELLSLVAQGEQDKAQQILQIHPEYLLHYGDVTDLSGRQFSNITPLQYAVWALDVRYMTNMMISCLPRNASGEEIRNALLEQYNQVETNGLKYLLRGKEVTEKHYRFKLNEELDNYVDSEDKDDAEWYDVGKTQYDLPAHVAQHYCEPDVSFNSCDFKAKNFKRTLHGIGTAGLSSIGGDNLYWYSEGLGVNYAIVRGLSSKGAGAYDDAPSCHGIYGRSKSGKASFWTGSSYDSGPVIDLKAMEQLEKTRKADLVELKLKLQTPLHELDEAAERQAQEELNETSSCALM